MNHIPKGELWQTAFTVHVVPADSLPSDFVVDTDAGTITLPINARLFSLVSALHTAKQHEPSIQTAPATTKRCRCWSTQGGEIAIVILPGIGKREIPMETAAGHPQLRSIFNRVREAEQAAWAGGAHATRPKAYVELSDAEVVELGGTKPRA